MRLTTPLLSFSSLVIAKPLFLIMGTLPTIPQSITVSGTVTRVHLGEPARSSSESTPRTSLAAQCAGSPRPNAPTNQRWLDGSMFKPGDQVMVEPHSQTTAHRRFRAAS
jgi:hypothetical protein